MTRPHPTPSAPPPRNRKAWAVGLTAGYSILLLILCGWVWIADESAEGTLLLFAPRWPALLPLALFGPLAIRARSWWAGVGIVVTSGLILGPVMGLRLSPETWSERPPAFSVLRVCTWNAEGHTPAESTREFFADHVPDVVLLIEQPNAPVAIKSTQGWTTLEGGNGIRLLSRYPARLEGQLGQHQMQMRGGAAHFSIETPDGTVNLYGVHLPTPRDGIEAAIANRLTDLSELKQSVLGRDTASSVVRDWIGQTDHPTIIAGDFNSPVESHIYRRHWGDLTNAFSSAGNGWGGTKVTRWHTVRIDHILCSSHFRAHRSVVGPEGSSDHRPVFAELVLLGE